VFAFVCLAVGRIAQKAVEIIMPPPLIGGGRGGGIKRCFCLTSVSVVFRPGTNKFGIGVAHVTRDSDTDFNVKRSKVKVTRPLYSPPCWRVRQLQRWAWERVGRGETAAALPSARPREALRRPRREDRGGGISWRPPTYSLFLMKLFGEVALCVRIATTRRIFSNKALHSGDYPDPGMFAGMLPYICWIGASRVSLSSFWKWVLLPQAVKEMGNANPYANKNG